MDGPCGTHGVRRNAYIILERNPEGKRQLGIPMHSLLGMIILKLNLKQ
jgi:hypothetical protein